MTSSEELTRTHAHNFFQVIRNSAKQKSEHVVIATLCLGEIGILHDLSTAQDIIQVISSNFHNEDDAIRQASAISLGSISIGNTGFFLEKVFALIESSQQ
jgi:hypothetical protein